MKPRAIDTVCLEHARDIAAIGASVLARLKPPLTPTRAFHEFDERGLDWLVSRVRRAADQSPDLRPVVADLQDHEILTIVIDHTEP